MNHTRTADNVPDMLGQALAVWRKQRASCFNCDEHRTIVAAMMFPDPDDPGRVFSAPLCWACTIRVSSSPKVRARLESKLGAAVGV